MGVDWLGILGGASRALAQYPEMQRRKKRDALEEAMSRLSMRRMESELGRQERMAPLEEELTKEQIKYMPESLRVQSETNRAALEMRKIQNELLAAMAGQQTSAPAMLEATQTQADTLEVRVRKQIGVDPEGRGPLSAEEWDNAQDYLTNLILQTPPEQQRGLRPVLAELIRRLKPAVEKGQPVPLIPRPLRPFWPVGSPSPREPSPTDKLFDRAMKSPSAPEDWYLNLGWGGM